MRRGALLVALLLVALSARARPRPPAPLSPGEHLRRAPIQRPLPGPGQVSVGRFLSAQHTARGPRARGRVGDYYLRTRELLAVVRASDGALVDVAAGPGFFDLVGWGRVEVCDGKSRHPVAPTGFGLLAGGATPALEVRGRVAALALEVRTRYQLSPGSHALVMVTELANAGPRDLTEVGLCESLGVSNTRLQVPGLGEVRRSQVAEALFGAYIEAGVSSLLMRTDGKPLRLRLDMGEPQLAFDPILSPEYERGPLRRGERVAVSRMLVVRPGPVHEALGEALATTSLAVLRARVELPSAPDLDGAPPTRALVRRDEKPYLLTRAARDLQLELPAGARYTVALRVPGVGDGPAVALAPDRTARPRLPASATLMVTLRDPRPAKLLIRGKQGTADPAFGSEEGMRLERVAYLGPGPERLLLAPGSYELVAGRGPAHELDRAEVRLVAGQARRVTLAPRRAVRTTGWLAADLHLHTTSSFDSPVRAEERLLPAAAEGVDLLALTDHNVISAAPLTTVTASWAPLVVSGQEVTSEGKLIGHFNVFPLQPGSEIAGRDTTPARIFAEARRRRPLPLIQVNHPRMGSIGYFDRMELDALSGRALPSYHAGYDLLEVVNGDQVGELASVDAVLGDYWKLLNRGHRYVATGGSDGHRLPWQEQGSPRTLILWDETEKKEGLPTVEQALAALRAGRAIVSTGPFVRFTVEGKPIGSLLRGGRPLALRAQVEAPSWMSVSSLVLVANGEPLQTVTRSTTAAPVRLELRRQVQPAVDTWYAVVARGERPDPTHLRKVLPFAVSNPIFVDVDGDGRCSPPGARPAR